MVDSFHNLVCDEMAMKLILEQKSLDIRYMNSLYNAVVELESNMDSDEPDIIIK